MTASPVVGKGNICPDYSYFGCITSVVLQIQFRIQLAFSYVLLLCQCVSYKCLAKTEYYLYLEFWEIEEYAPKLTIT